MARPSPTPSCVRVRLASSCTNERIVERVNASGDAYLTHTRLGGRVCIRVGLRNVLTTEHHRAHVWTRVLMSAADVAAP